MHYRYFLWLILLFSCNSKPTSKSQMCDQAWFDRPHSQIQVDPLTAYDDGTLCGLVVKVLGFDSASPLFPCQIEMIRANDTISINTDSSGIAVIERGGLDGNWQLRITARGYNCLIVSGVPMRGGYQYGLRVSLKKVKVSSTLSSVITSTPTLTSCLYSPADNVNRT